MPDFRQRNAWAGDALRYHGCAPDPLHFPGRKPPSLFSGGSGAFLWIYARGERRFEYATPGGKLTNADVSSMLFRAGIRVEIPADDLNGERHPRLMGTETLTPEAVSALIAEAPGAQHDRDTRESA